MILLDTSGVLAAARSNDVNHRVAREALLSASAPLLLSPFVLTELDYMIRRDIGQSAALRLLDDVASGAYTLVPFSTEDVQTASSVMRRYEELQIGLADASLVVLSGRYHVHDIFTFDRRHFRALRTLDGQPFRLTPEDNP